MRVTVNTVKVRLKLFMIAALSLATGSGVLAKEYVIKLKEGPSFQDSLYSLSTEKNLKVYDTHETGKLVLVDLDETLNTLESRVKQLSSLQDVEYIVPNIKLHTFDAPNDPQLSSQWALSKVNALDAWEIQVGNSEVVIAVIDTGINWKHEDLVEHIWENPSETPGNGIDDDQNGFVDDIRGWDFRDNDNNPDDETSSRNPGHGTHCAGIIGAVSNNGKGIAGIARKVSLMPVRFLGSDGSGDLMSAAKAIDYASNNGADIISASWGAQVARANVGPILEAIERAGEKGVIFVAAAANDGRNNDTREIYPANAGFDNVISVAASDPDDKKPSWSNFGKATVDLASPGLNILSTVPVNNYQNLSGTSMATPLTAGAVALILSQAEEDGRALKPIEIRSILQASGTKVEIETACACRIDVAAALESVHKDALTIVPNSSTLEINKTKLFYGIGGEAPYTFTSSDSSIASITADGTLTAIANGETIVTITDASGNSAQTSKIYVGQTSGGGGDGQCPFGPLCDVMCQINPSLPWCN